MCSVHVDRGIEHMQGWGQRIATRTGVEQSSGEIRCTTSGAIRCTNIYVVPTSLPKLFTEFQRS